MRSKFNKFLTLLAVLIFGITNVWGAVTTEVYNATGASSGTDMVKTGSTLLGTHIAGQGGGNITDYSPANKGVKLRTQQTKVTISDESYGYAVITANSGYSLKSFKLEGTSNGSNSIDLLGVYVDVDATSASTLATSLAAATNQLSSTVTFPDKKTTYVSSPELSINANSNIVMLFPGSGDNQMRAIITIGYEAAPVTNYTVTIDPNGGSYAETPDGWTYSAGVYTKSIASGTSFSAPAGLTKGTDDLTWKDGSDNPITFPVSITGDITFVAQWAPHAASSDATLSALSVAGCTLNETFDPATTAYTITLPFYGAMPVVGDVTATKNDPNAEDPEVSISGNVITVHCVAEDGTAEKDYTITVTISPAPTASSSINIEQLVLDHGTKYDIGTALDNAHIGYVDKDALDSLKDQSGRNEPYLGLKFKKTTSKVTIIVPASTELNVKFGYIDGSAGLKVSVNGSAAATPSLTSNVYTLAASAGVKEVVFIQTGAKTVVYKQIMVGEAVQSVTLPWLVTYDAGEHGTCATAKETWTGTALTLPAVTPESGWNFEGWKDDEDNSVVSPYTPTKNVTLTAQYTAQASPYDLTSLTYKIGTGAATNVGYTDGTYTYNIVLPYKASYDAITVTPVLKEATSYLKGDEVLTVSSLPGAATFTVVEAGAASEQLYTVNFTKAPKDGLSIIKAIADATNQDIKAENLSGLYKKAGHIYTSGSYKLDQKRYFMVQLEDGKNFQEGDVVEINVSSVNDCNGFTIYSNISGDDFADGDLIVDTHDETGAATKVSAGINKITLPSYAGSNKLYVARKSGTEKYLNAGINQVEVKRAMNPVLTAIQFNSTDVAVSSTSVSATLPSGTNLGTMTVTPTIVWNGAGTAAPTAAWAWGANTYRVTDKDGDYTDYTVTLTEALAPSAAPTITTQPASDNYYEGATIAALEVVATGSGDLSYQWYLGSDEIDGATAATYTPTVSAIGSYVYHCVVTNTETGHPATSLASDNATITISEDPAAIKLLDGSTVNHTNFITGVTASTVEIESVEYNCVAFAGTVSGVNAVKDLTRVVAYNATTTQTKVQLKLYNSNGNSRTIEVKGVVEGSTDVVNLASITLTGNEQKTTEWIEFNNATNRTIYIYVSSNAGHIKILQTKVIESGTALKMAGEAGYSLNFNKGRFFGVKDETAHFEGLDVEVKSSDCQPLSTTVVKLASSSISFDVAVPVTLTVTTNNDKTYYVTEGAAGTDNETAKTGVSEFNLTAGTWYITGGTSNVEITSIAFTAPKCQKPTITTQPASNHTFGPGNLTATVEAEVSDGGTLSYQWYDASDNSEVTGQTTAMLTTTTEGTYYVIVTNSLAGHQDSSIKSDEATLAYRDASDATLSALSVSEGTLDPTFDPAELNYRVDLPEGTTTVPTLTATATMAGYASVVIFNEGSFTNYEAVSTVTVTSEDLSDTKVYTVHFYVAHAIATLVDVTENTTWDWTLVTKKKDGTIIDGNGPIVTEAEDGLVIANYLLGENWDKIEGNNGAYAIRNSTDKKVYQGANLHIHTTKGGYLSIWAANEGHTMTLNVNNAGRDMELATLTGSQVEYKVYVQAGDVTIHNVPASGTSPMRVSKIIFTVDEAPDYTRTEMIGNGVLGTICLPNNVPAGAAIGATFYELVGKEATYGKIVFAEVSELEAGVPYIFQAHGDRIDFFYGETSVSEPDNTGALKGTFNGELFTAEQAAEKDIYFFRDHALWSAKETGLQVLANRAWLEMGDVKPITNPNPAPGRRYIMLGTNGTNVATGINDVQDDVRSTKMLIDGRLFILRGEKIYDATGRLVK